jgi:ribonuclease HII
MKAAPSRRPTAAPSKPSGPPRPNLAHERRLWREGHQWVVGLDEVGRGAWAGPISVGAVALKPGTTGRTMPKLLRDSKLLLEQHREKIFDQVSAWCACWAVGHASADECDEWGMTAAQRLAAYRALSSLPIEADVVVLDGPFNFLREPPVQLELGVDGPPSLVGPDYPQPAIPSTVLALIDADAYCATVSAASVLAKVVRDRLMREEARHYPMYQFEENKGYPSPVHKWALRGYGLSVIHRRTWAFVSGVPWQGGWKPLPARLLGVGAGSERPLGVAGDVFAGGDPSSYLVEEVLGQSRDVVEELVEAGGSQDQGIEVGIGPHGGRSPVVT